MRRNKPTFDEAFKEDTLPVRKDEKKEIRLDPERVWRDAQAFIHQRHAKLSVKRQMKTHREVEGMTLRPELSARSRSMMKRGYIRPGEPGYDDQYQKRRINIDDAKVQEARECTFR